MRRLYHYIGIIFFAMTRVELHLGRHRTRDDDGFSLNPFFINPEDLVARRVGGIYRILFAVRVYGIPIERVRNVETLIWLREAIQTAMVAQGSDDFFFPSELDSLKLSITFLMPRPDHHFTDPFNRTPESVYPRFYGDNIRDTRVPSVTSLLRLVTDALVTVVYENTAMITSVTIKKVYDNEDQCHGQIRIVLSPDFDEHNMEF